MTEQAITKTSLMFALRLRKARVAAGLTQKEMAEKLYMSQTNYNQYERGKCEPSLDTLARISKILGCSVDWLLGLRNIGDAREDDE